MNKGFLFACCFSWFTIFGQSTNHDLHFEELATRWDEAVPLGNAMLGALIWQKDSNLRFSLDRADLWDQRPMKGLHREEFTFKWVLQKIKEKDYAPVQKYFDHPYDNEPAPSKIPGGALEFDTKAYGQVQSVHLKLEDAMCEVRWSSGVVLKTYVHATLPVGWFRFENLPAGILPELIAPRYQGAVTNSSDPVGGDDLARLGYKQGTIIKQQNSITYKQQGWNGFAYEINVMWKKVGTVTEGTWSISSNYSKLNKSSASFAGSSSDSLSGSPSTDPSSAKTISNTTSKTTSTPSSTSSSTSTSASSITSKMIEGGFYAGYATHKVWWKKFWSKSSIHVPDSLIEKQWYLEQYKFGASARKDAPPISLQAVWTADNGRLPPWKGDFHHDLNTQLSYWPSYSGNHLEESIGYLDHLDQNNANYKRYTKMYFETDGIAVPGVTTLDGTEMGGWIQYSFSPTVSAWLAQHYYLQWRYSMDRQFLKQRAYPWIKDVAIFLEKLTSIDSNGHRQLPASASPEINDNSLEAWFPQNTNYDLALMKFSFSAALELALELGLKEEAGHWKKLQNEFSDYALTNNNELMFAPSMAYNQSHRHFSNAMAIHPLGLIKWEDGERSQAIIKNTISMLDSVGPDYWCGYSYAWLANLKARAKDGAGASKALEIFAKAFCSVNSFHLNGDQTKSGYSKFQYRPFTLEGNFAFAAGLQEMMLQSYAGFIEIMPAVPDSWKDVSFHQLRAEGAFLVDAQQKNGAITEVKISAEKSGITRLKLPFKNWKILSVSGIQLTDTKDGFVRLTCKAGGRLVLGNLAR